MGKRKQKNGKRHNTITQTTVGFSFAAVIVVVLKFVSLCAITYL